MWRRAQAAGETDYLMVGLGNPGTKYAGTRHNAGWWVLDELARRHSAGGGYSRHQSSVQQVGLGKRRVLLIRPQTYMNLSGDAVAAWLRQYAETPWVLVHDDTSLPPGEIKLKRSGGDGGHNGVFSVIERLKTQQFDRLKIGIGPPPHPGGLSDYVLGEPFPAEQELLRGAVLRAADTLDRLAAQGFDKAAQFASGGDLKQEQRRKERAERAAREAADAETEAADAVASPADLPEAAPHS